MGAMAGAAAALNFVKIVISFPMCHSSLFHVFFFLLGTAAGRDSLRAEEEDEQALA